MESIKPCAMYLRKSRADVEAEARGEGETLARHRRALTELAERRGLNVVRIYEEIVTGDTIASRPQMQALLSAVEHGEYSAVIVNDADRLARGDSIDQGLVKQAFEATGTLIITPFKTFDPNDTADEDFFDFSLFMARFEFKYIKRRLQTGRMRSAAEGNYLGTRAVYGYLRAKRPDRAGWTLEPDPEKAKIVQMVFELYAHGLGAPTIANRLDDMGLRTDLGFSFTASSVRHMLRNPIYIGTVSWGKKMKQVRVIEGKRLETRELNTEPIIIENAHPAIIDRDLWDEVQRIFDTHGKRPKNLQLQTANVLAGLVRCSICGRSMQRKPGVYGRPDMIHCPTRGCPTTSIYIPIVEEALLDTLQDWSARYSAHATDASPTASAEDPALRAIHRQIALIEKQLNSLHDLVEQGVYTPADFVRRRDDLISRKSAAEDQLAALKSTPSVESQICAELPQIRNVLDAYPLTDDLTLKNELLHSVISRVVYEKTRHCFRNENPADYLTLTVYPSLQPPPPKK